MNMYLVHLDSSIVNFCLFKTFLWTVLSLESLECHKTIFHKGQKLRCLSVLTISSNLIVSFLTFIRVFVYGRAGFCFASSSFDVTGGGGVGSSNTCTDSLKVTRRLNFFVWWYRLGGGKLDDVEIDDPDDSEADDWYERYALCVSVTILVTGALSIGAECERSSGAWALNIASGLGLVQYEPSLLHSSFDVHFPC